MRLLCRLTFLSTFLFSVDRVSDENIFNSTVSTIQNFQFNKSNLRDSLTSDYLISLTKIEKKELYDSLKQNIPLNMLLTAIAPTSGHFRVDKGLRGLKIVGYGCLAFGIPWVPLLAEGDVNDGGYLLIIAAYLSIPISYCYLLFDSGVQTVKYNNEIENIIFNSDI